MNKNIIEIVKRAKSYVHGISITEAGLTLQDDGVIEEFVKLIAKECADLCMEEYRTMDGWGRTSADTRCHELICKTFDVESRWR